MPKSPSKKHVASKRQKTDEARMERKFKGVMGGRPGTQQNVTNQMDKLRRRVDGLGKSVDAANKRVETAQKKFEASQKRVDASTKRVEKLRKKIFGKGGTKI